MPDRRPFRSVIVMTIVFELLQSASSQHSNDWVSFTHVMVGMKVAVGDGESTVGLDEMVGSGDGTMPHSPTHTV